MFRQDAEAIGVLLRQDMALGASPPAALSLQDGSAGSCCSPEPLDDDEDALVPLKPAQEVTHQGSPADGAAPDTDDRRSADLQQSAELMMIIPCHHMLFVLEMECYRSANRVGLLGGRGWLACVDAVRRCRTFVRTLQLAPAAVRASCLLTRFHSGTGAAAVAAAGARVAP